MKNFTFVILAVFSLAACNRQPQQPASQTAEQGSIPEAAPASDQINDSMMASLDVSGTPADNFKAPEYMQLQVALDEMGFSPGVIDGKMGLSTKNALKAFQERQGLKESGTLDDKTKAALEGVTMRAPTRMVTIPAGYASLAFMPLPDEPEAQAKLPALGYENLWEKLAERFHTTPEVLQMLNPQPAAAAPQQQDDISNKVAAVDETADVPPPAAGSQLRVPNIGHEQIEKGEVTDADWQTTLVSLGVGSQQPKAEKIVVDKSAGTLKVYDSGDVLVAAFTVTTGSSHDPLPLGTWKVKGVSYNPPFFYNPALFWDVSDSKEKLRLPPGPNGPVGVTWIDISKPHYGIHGTPHPESIGRSESHGCVRLTNWDAARLAQMVKTGVSVVFEA